MDTYSINELIVIDSQLKYRIPNIAQIDVVDKTITMLIDGLLIKYPNKVSFYLMTKDDKMAKVKLNIINDTITATLYYKWKTLVRRFTKKIALKRSKCQTLECLTMIQPKTNLG